MNSVLGVIPVRYNSSRFPGKAIATLAGKPMVQWVWERACAALPDVVIATDDKRIHDVCRKFGAKVVMTSKKCQSGADRVAQVAEKMPFSGYLNIQGDEPLIAPPLLKSLSLALRDPAVHLVTAACPLAAQDAGDPNVVKVVTEKSGNALYFSRAAIPHSVTAGAKYLKHIGIYGFKRKTLLRFTRIAQPEIEKRERLEQLRALYHGIPIRVILVKHDTIGVDTPQDFKKAETLIKKYGIV